MNSIAKYFDKNFKKLELSDESKTSAEPKKHREDNEISYIENPDVFSEGIESEDCKSILYKCLKNLDKKVNEIYNLARSTQQIQIKGDGHLSEIQKTVDFLSTKFDKLEQDRIKKEEMISGLQNEVSALNKKVATLEKQADDQEQYSRRNCLLLHGTDEDQDESTDVKVINIVKDKLEIEISESDIDRSHRIGKKSSGKKRPIIIKFARYNCRRHVYHNKKKLKDSGMSITESLTKFRLSKLNEARDHHGFRNVWSVDGRIMFKDGEDKPKLYYQ